MYLKVETGANSREIRQLGRSFYRSFAIGLFYRENTGPPASFIRAVLCDFESYLTRSRWFARKTWFAACRQRSHFCWIFEALFVHFSNVCNFSPNGFQITTPGNNLNQFSHFPFLAILEDPPAFSLSPLCPIYVFFLLLFHRSLSLPDTQDLPMSSKSGGKNKSPYQTSKHAKNNRNTPKICVCVFYTHLICHQCVYGTTLVWKPASKMWNTQNKSVKHKSKTKKNSLWGVSQVQFGLAARVIQVQKETDRFWLMCCFVAQWCWFCDLRRFCNLFCDLHVWSIFFQNLYFHGELGSPDHCFDYFLSNASFIEKL